MGSRFERAQRGRARLLALALATAVLSCAAGAAHAAEAVDLELVLAADGSGSIDEDELRVQREGYAQAITSQAVLGAIRAGAHRAIALTYVEWGGPESQHTVVDWMVIRDEASAAAFAEQLRARPRLASGYNSISGAIDYAAAQIGANAYEAARRIIDISGDGPQIGGRPVQAARDEAVLAGITINALVVNRPGGGYPGPGGEPLLEHYERDVIGGFGAFVMTVEEETSFAAAIRNKMVLEIAEGPVGGLLAPGEEGRYLPGAAAPRVELGAGRTAAGSVAGSAGNSGREDHP